MGCHPEILAFLLLACSVNVTPLPQSNIPYSNSTKLRFARSEFNSDVEATQSEQGIQYVPRNSGSCAKGSSFCENAPGYPRSYLESWFKENPDCMLGSDIDKSPSPLPEEENSLCPSGENMVFPQSGINSENEWLFIVNHGKYRQGVRIEICLGGSDLATKCAFSELFPMKYKAMCQQKYIYRTLLALKKNGRVVRDNFILPASCSCSITNVPR